MEIYIQITSDDDGTSVWWNADGNQSYFMDGRELEAVTEWGEEYLRGTAFNSIRKAMKEARYAKNLASYDGIVDPKVTFWRMTGGKLIKTKFTRDGKIKK